MLFRWFLDMGIEDGCFVATTFTKNRDRLLSHEVADKFFKASVDEARLRGYVSDDHFTADGSLLEAWASVKSFKPRVTAPGDDGRGDGPAIGGRDCEVNFHGEKRSNATHESTTDPEARLMRKSNAHAGKLQFAAHVLMENRSGLIVATVTHATGRAERETTVELLKRLPAAGRRRRTLGVDKGYDT
jgi:hypothetical protein